MDAVLQSRTLIARAEKLLDAHQSADTMSKAYRQLQEIRESLRRLEQALARGATKERRRWPR